ncbi:hypothetical protein SCLARK_00284 [Spiroplasma clarkii]|uniref:hypothetical protein n=1 Tax=Spiroplasma clarkii TaxID=2139 RepID=UPI000B561A17|nr:hypothetical protein [Spiroplasma clarkii]ARU91041.1 hypothetical protein SCLARK_00284 [Spiroplasma clarkii]
MKKLLTLLSIVGITSATTSGVVACKPKTEDTITESEKATAAKQYLMTEEVIGHKDLIISTNNSEELTKMAEKIVEIFKTKTDLKFDFEGESVEIDSSTFAVKGSGITVSAKQGDVTEVLEFKWETATEINLVVVEKLQGKEIMKSAAEITAKEFSIKKDLNLQSSYASDITFKSTAIDGASITVQEVTGDVKVGDDFLTTSTEFSLKISLVNSVNTLNELAKSAWKSNTFVNGIPTYDGGVYGIIPSSLHDAIALHTGDNLTGKYIFIKEMTGRALQKADINPDDGTIKEDFTDKLEITKFGLWDAKENKEIEVFDLDDYLFVTKTTESIINQYCLSSVNANTAGKDEEPEMEWIPSWARYADEYEDFLINNFQALFYIGDTSVEASTKFTKKLKQQLLKLIPKMVCHSSNTMTLNLVLDLHLKI